MKLKNIQGMALVATLALVTLLTVIGIGFAVSMRLEVKASKNYLNQIKAKLISESGIAKVIAELKYGQSGATANAVDTQAEWDAVWTRAVWDATENGWIFGIDNDGIDTDGDGTVDEAGELDNGLMYEVIARDEASKINVNDTNANLAAILNNLAAIIGGGTIDANTGDIIVGNRPAGGYLTIEEIKRFKTLGTADNQTINQAEFDLLENFITVHSWINTKTVNPLLVNEPRAPINVNTAQTEVLQAVLRGLAATGRIPNDSFSTVTLTISDSEALTLATNLIANRPYSSWDDLWTQLQADETAGNINNGDAALVMANANPNTDLMKLNPNKSWLDKHRYYSASLPAAAAMTVTDITIDKHDLSAYTTEFCFHSGGVYAMISTGRVFNDPDSSAGAAQLAEAMTQCIVRLFDVVHETTQADFRAGVTSNLDDYPEPSFAAAALWDGQLMLRTLIAPAATGTNRLQASFTNGADAEAGGGTLTAVFAVSANATPNPCAANPTPTSVSPEQDNPADILNDGYFVDRSFTAKTTFYKSRSTKLQYEQPGNIFNRSGTMEMWIKTLWDGSGNWTVGGAAQNRVFFSAGSDKPATVGTIHTEVDGGGFIALYKFQSQSPYGGPVLKMGAANYFVQLAGTDNVISYQRWLGNFNSDIQGGTGAGYDHWEGYEWKHIAMTWGPEVNAQNINVNGKSRAIAAPDKGFNFFLYYNGELWSNWRVSAHNGHKNYTDSGWGHDDTGIENSGGESWVWYDDKRMAGSEYTIENIDTDGDTVADAPPPGNRFSIIDDLSPPYPANTRVWGAYPGVFDTDRRLYVGWDLEPPAGKYIDATIDEFRIHDTELSAATIASHYNAGRYYTGGDATFTSQAIDMSGGHIATISWSEHLPGGISGADITMDMSLDDGATWQSLGLTDPNGGVVDLAGTATVKYRAAFLESESQLLDTPLLDDITITVIQPTEILYWRYVSD